MTTMERPRDVVGGLVVAAIGAGFFAFGRELEAGTSFRMGPGYFPTILSVLMILLGLAMVAIAWRQPATEGSVGGVPWLGLALVVAPVVFFGLTLRGLGLAPVLVVVVLATAWASRYRSLRASVPLALGIAAFCSALFIRGLGLPLPLVGPWLTAGYWSPAPAPDAAAPAPAPDAAAPAPAPAQ
jgi:Tripartite tricarboxylate transporter TctB family